MKMLARNRAKMQLTSLFASFMLMGNALAQFTMPDDEALKNAMRAAQIRAASVLDTAERQAQPSSVVPPLKVPQFDPRTASGTDPAVLAEKYKQLGKPTDSEAPELIIFVSVSMPVESLQRIGQQARQANAVVVFRGLKFGLRKGTMNDSMKAMKPVVDTGADVEIHPELFERYNVTTVPTVVVAAAPQAGCQDSACAAKSASVVGDVTLDYALERLTDRDDEVGRIARARLKRLRNS